jgi:hypothetical protein
VNQFQQLFWVLAIVAAVLDPCVFFVVDEDEEDDFRVAVSLKVISMPCTTRMVAEYLSKLMIC